MLTSCICAEEEARQSGRASDAAQLEQAGLVQSPDASPLLQPSSQSHRSASAGSPGSEASVDSVVARLHQAAVDGVHPLVRSFREEDAERELSRSRQRRGERGKADTKTRQVTISPDSFKIAPTSRGQTDLLAHGASMLAESGIMTDIDDGMSVHMYDSNIHIAAAEDVSAQRLNRSPSYTSTLSRSRSASPVHTSPCRSPHEPIFPYEPRARSSSTRHARSRSPARRATPGQRGRERAGDVSLELLEREVRVLTGQTLALQNALGRERAAREQATQAAQAAAHETAAAKEDADLVRHRLQELLIARASPGAGARGADGLETAGAAAAADGGDGGESGGVAVQRAGEARAEQGEALAGRDGDVAALKEEKRVLAARVQVVLKEAWVAR